MTMQAIDDATRERIRVALTSPDLIISKGLGRMDGPRCTIAEINLILVGRLSDGPHPCMSEVIRRWVIAVQDVMPDDLRNALAWREAAVGIAGSVADDAIESRRRDMILSWMWEALSDESVLTAIPVGARPAWDMMLSGRTAEAAAEAAYAAYAVADAAAEATQVAAEAAEAVAYAYDVVVAVAAAVAAATGVAAVVDVVAAAATDAGVAVDAYWRRRNPADLLRRLIEVTA